MSNRGQGFIVEVKRSTGYASKPGDARRSGRVYRGTSVVTLQFSDRGSHIDALLGVVPVGAITIDPASKGYFWSVELAGMSRVPRPARDIEKAKDAIAHKVREWCEAAKLISTRGANG
jgi:hypothetical protein